jgi:acetyl/propionyl-CoA carboxylase alpha subunit
VTQYYDSLLAKLIVHAPDRPRAVARLREALLDYRVEGVTTNLDVLLAIAENDAFARGAVHTGFIAEQRILEELANPPAAVVAAAAAHDLTLPAGPEPWSGPVAWRVGRLAQPSTWSIGGRLRTAALTQEPEDAGNVRVELEGTALEVRLVGSGRVQLDGDRAEVEDRPPERLVSWRGRTYRLRRPAPPDPEQLQHDGPDGGTGTVVAPMPGLIVGVTVGEGDRVDMNQVLVVMEAMKMEHQVVAPHAGIVSSVLVAPNQLVTSGQPLIEVRPE